MSPPDTPPDGDASDWSGRILRERYRVESVLGVGGMGTAFKAFDLKLERAVVLKVPHARHVAADESRGRFQEEIRKLIAIEHPHVVKVFDVDDEDGAPFAVFPFLAGGNLSARMKASGGPLPAEAVVPWLTQIADALDDLHERGDLHRDVKPDNILFDKPLGKGRANAYLADFGLAKALGLDPARLFQSRTGTLIGTQAYMAPEQFTNLGPVTGAVDQYALATTVYRALSGEMPFTVSTSEELAVAKAMTSPRPLRTVAKGVPPGVDRAVMRALSATPTARFRTCGEFAREFETAVGRGTSVGASAAGPAAEAAGASAAGSRGSPRGVPAVPGPVGSPTRISSPPAAHRATNPGATPPSGNAGPAGVGTPPRGGRRTWWIAAALVTVGGLGGAGLWGGWFQGRASPSGAPPARGEAAALPGNPAPPVPKAPRVPEAPPPSTPAPAPKAPAPAPPAASPPPPVEALAAPSAEAVALAEAKALAEGGDWEGLRAKLALLNRLSPTAPEVPAAWIEGLARWDAPPDVAIEWPVEAQTVEEPVVEVRGRFRSFRTFDVLKVNGAPTLAPGGRFAVKVSLRAEGAQAVPVTVEYQGVARLTTPLVRRFTYAVPWRRPLAQAVAAAAAQNWEAAKRALAEARTLGVPGTEVPASLTEGIARWEAPPVLTVEYPVDRSEWLGRAFRLHGTLSSPKGVESVTVEGLETEQPATVTLQGGAFSLEATLKDAEGEREFRLVARDSSGRRVGEPKTVRFTMVSLSDWIRAAIDAEADEEGVRKMRLAVEYVEANPTAPEARWIWRSAGDEILDQARKTNSWARWVLLAQALEATPTDSDFRFELRLVGAGAAFRLGRPDAPAAFRRVVEAVGTSTTRPSRLADLINFLREQVDDAPSAKAAYGVALAVHPEWQDPEFAGGLGRLPLLERPLAAFPTGLVDLEGKPVALSDYAGKVLLLYFAHACHGPCFKHQAGLNALYADVHGQGLEVLGVDGYDESDDRLRKYLEGVAFPWRQVAHGDGRAELAKRYSKGSLPFWILLGRDQRVVEVGTIYPEHLARSVARALEARSTPPGPSAPRGRTTPHLVLQKLEDARAQAAKAGLTLKATFRGAEEAWTPKGVVAQQTPKVGEPLPSDKTLQVVVSGFEDGVPGRPVLDWAHVSEAQVAEAKRLAIPVAFENDLGMRFVLVPSGTFSMGSPEGEEHRDADETQHTVALSRAYYVSIRETTNAEYRRFQADHDSGAYQGVTLNDDGQPVVNVSQADAVAFATWSSGREPPPVYRLPPEGEGV